MNLVINGRFLSQRMTGVQRVAREFVAALDELIDRGAFPNLHVRLVAQCDAILGDLELKHIEVERLGNKRGHIWEQFTLPKHIGRAALLCLGNTAPISTLLSDQPVAVMLHDLAYRLYPKDYTRLYRYGHIAGDWLILRRARPLLTVSAAEREMIASFAPHSAQRILVAPNGGWSGHFEPKPARRTAPATDAYGLCVGALSQRKNIDGIVAVAVELARERGLRFRFVGPVSPLSTWIASSIPSDVRPLITFRGYVDDKELRDLYSEAAFLLYPSLHEASGLPPIEAMAFGCPVITSDIPVMKERCGDAAEYCDPLDIASIKAATLRIIDDRENTRMIVDRGFERARNATWYRQVEIVIAAITREFASVIRDR